MRSMLLALEPALIRAVIRTESAFDPLAVSSAGAQGLMQLMPALTAEMGVADAFDPRDNIMAGTQYLSVILDLVARDETPR
jgi:soluble lytic murein transglycosylase-like protein